MPYKNPEDQREAQRRYYRRHREEVKKSVYHWRKDRREQIRRYIFDYLSAHSCVDCGEIDPVVLEFDHRDGVDKKFSICHAAAKVASWKKLKAEIAKCDVRCANCHRRRTAKKQGWYERWIDA